MTTSKNNKCVFVGGVHGMGKSSLCAASAKNLNIGHYVASELIKKYKDLDTGLHKEVRSVATNQETLLSAIARFVTHPTYLLDGHFVIRAKDQGLVRIPLETYAAIGPDAIIVVEGNPKEASGRILERDGKIISEAQLNEMQIIELQHAEFISSELTIPFFACSNLDSSGFTKLIKQVLSA